MGGRVARLILVDGYSFSSNGALVGVNATLEITRKQACDARLAILVVAINPTGLAGKVAGYGKQRHPAAT